jgi:ergothioneine biosynthesis protein EgtB
MSDAAPSTRRIPRPNELLPLFRSVRHTTRQLAAPLSDADATVQSMPDASPAKWHLAHTSWFFEQMVLCPHLPGYRVFDDSFNFLFNSYYESVGARHPRPRRGMLTRPTLEAIGRYRDHVEAGIEKYLDRFLSDRVAALIELGCHHEQQHQELLLTDILHLFAQNPLCPAYKAPGPLAVQAPRIAAITGDDYAGGLIEVGHGEGGFAFDSEEPRHRVWLDPYRLDRCPVTNAQWLQFVADGGYRTPLLWLSAGWAKVLEEHWSMPLYWEERDGEIWSMTLRGAQPIDPAAPVTHVSYFEADAFATWAGKRLATEFEWEHAASTVPMSGNFLESGRLRPKGATDVDASAASQTSSGTLAADGPLQLFGDVWEWTRSAFAPYPRFRPSEGAAGEYNGKFMSGQYVLRGGSCVTPASHMRTSYRNFFPPEARWQFSGVRLAEDA